MSSRLVVVTGGNRGLGFEMCKRLGQNGFRVILGARDEGKAKEAKGKLEKMGVSVECHVLDMCRESTIEEFVVELEKKHGRCDVLINNAGIYIPEWTKESFEKVMNSNVYGQIALTNRILPLMLKNGYGRVITISSGLGQLTNVSKYYRQLLSPSNDVTNSSPGGPFAKLSVEEFKKGVPFLADDQEMRRISYPAYNLSKVVLNTWTRLLVAKLRTEHPNESADILINVVDPGWVRTDMGGPHATRSIEEGVDTALWLATHSKKGDPSGLFFANRKTISW